MQSVELKAMRRVVGCALGALVSCLCVFGMSHYVHAQVVGTHAVMAFGQVDFSTSYNVRLQLGTDGNLNIVGSGAVAGGGEGAGHIRITSPDTGIVDVKCAAEGVLSDPSATDLTIENVEIAVTSGVSFGNGTACQGVGGGDPVTLQIDMDAIPDPDVYIGGEIIIPSPVTLPTDKTYSTTGAGTPIELSITVQ